MEIEEREEVGFVYEQNDGQSNFKQNIIQKYQASYNPAHKQMQQPQPQGYPSTQSNTADEHTIGTTVVKVLPTESHHNEGKSLAKIEQNILYSSQTSESSQFQNEKIQTVKQQGYYAQQNNNLVFDIQESEQFEESPQSSMRKLYRHIEIRQPPKLYECEPKEKLIRNELPQQKHLNQHQTFQYQQEEDYSEDEQYEIESKINAKQLRSSNISDLIMFPIPKTKMIRCLVIVANNKFFSLESIFDLYLVQEKRHLLRARKRRFRIFSTFEIFEKELETTNKIASISSNFTRTEYKLLKCKQQRELSSISEKNSSQLFSSDIIKMSAIEVKQDVKVVEEQRGYIGYQSNILGFSQQKLNMFRPKTNQLAKSDRFSDLKTAYENCEYERVQCFSTRLAEKGIDGKLVLDFKDKNITNSSRNMIIQNQHGQAGLMFAKFSEDIYILNVMSPFNLLEGFFLGLCNLDRKPFVS